MDTPPSSSNHHHHHHHHNSNNHNSNNHNTHSDGRAIFVSNFAVTTTAGDLTALFQRYGAVSRLDMKRGFCFIFMADEEAGRAALKNLNHSLYLTDPARRPGRRLIVQWARGDGPVKRREDQRRKSTLTSPTQPNDTLFVVNFDPHHTRLYHHLRQLFQPHGPILRLDLNDRFAFVQYTSVHHAAHALAALNGHILGDRRLIVEYTTSHHQYNNYNNNINNARKRLRSHSPSPSPSSPHTSRQRIISPRPQPPPHDISNHHHRRHSHRNPPYHDHDYYSPDQNNHHPDDYNHYDNNPDDYPYNNHRPRHDDDDHNNDHNHTRPDRQYPSSHSHSHSQSYRDTHRRHSSSNNRSPRPSEPYRTTRSSPSHPSHSHPRRSHGDYDHTDPNNHLMPDRSYSPDTGDTPPSRYHDSHNSPSPHDGVHPKDLDPEDFSSGRPTAPSHAYRQDYDQLDHGSSDRDYIGQGSPANHSDMYEDANSDQGALDPQRHRSQDKQYERSSYRVDQEDNVIEHPASSMDSPGGVNGRPDWTGKNVLIDHMGGDPDDQPYSHVPSAATKRDVRRNTSGRRSPGHNNFGVHPMADDADTLGHTFDRLENSHARPSKQGRSPTIAEGNAARSLDEDQDIVPSRALDEYNDAHASEFENDHTEGAATDEQASGKSPVAAE